MHNMHPDDRSSHGAHRFNEFIYQRMGELINDRHPQEMIDDPNTLVFQNIDGRVQALQKKGVEPIRIAVVSAIAHIDISGQRERFTEEFSAEA